MLATPHDYAFNTPGHLSSPDKLVNLPALVAAFYALHPHADEPAHRVAFGTSGHRGSSLNNTFNYAHILAITQAIVEYRVAQKTTGPLFLAKDTHALSDPAFCAALEVLAANEVTTFVDAGCDETRGAPGYTPTPALSHAILQYNAANHSKPQSDGIVITPSHNPPEDGGFKYNPPSGGPADTTATKWIQDRANELIAAKLDGVKRLAYGRAIKAATTQRHDYLSAYVGDLGNIIDFPALAGTGLKLAVDPLGGAGVHYWPRIAEPLQATAHRAEPLRRRTLPLHDAGLGRQDPHGLQFAQRDGVDDREYGHLRCRMGMRHRPRPPRHRLQIRWAAQSQSLPRCVYPISVYPPSGVVGDGRHRQDPRLLQHHRPRRERPGPPHARSPVGFKWFVDGLIDGSLGFVGEESAGATFLRLNGKVWTTDKDGLILGLLAAEMTARTGKDPGELYGELTAKYGAPVYQRIDAAATKEEKAKLGKLSPSQVTAKELACEPITAILTEAPGNKASIGGLKVTTENGWFAARPSGTEDVYKIYAESFNGPDHLKKIQKEAKALVAKAIA